MYAVCASQEDETPMKVIQPNKNCSNHLLSTSNVVIVVLCILFFNNGYSNTRLLFGIIEFHFSPSMLFGLNSRPRVMSTTDKRAKRTSAQRITLTLKEQ